MSTFTCVGCIEIQRRGGGQWHSGEPHYVGCPTELESLRRECRSNQSVKLRDVVGQIPHQSTPECADYACPRCDLDTMLLRYEYTGFGNRPVFVGAKCDA